jgi:diguanylate cyclase (GGDEF)-like protein
MTALEHAAEILSRDTTSLAARWRERCAEGPGVSPDPPVARAFVVALADALGSPDVDAPEVAELLRAPLEFDHEAAVSVEQMGALREVLHRHLLTELDPAEAIPAVEVLSRLVDTLLVAVMDRAFGRLEAAAFLDPLTGVGNRRALDRDATPLLATAQRHNRPLSVIVIDIDGLKRVNDTEGHAAGDDAIRRLATTLDRHLRSGDAVYRVGGDEFVLVLPETRPADVAPLLQRAIGQAPSFTYGVAGFPDDGFALDQLVNAADQQLLDYRRRTRGGDAGRRPADAQGRRTHSPPPGQSGEPAATDVVDLSKEEGDPASPSTARSVHRIAVMPWPEQDIEERLYELPDVLAARVSDEGGSLHVGVLVRPTADRDLLPDAILDRIQLVAGAVPELVDLRVMPLGATAETRLVRPAAGVRVTTAPSTPPPAGPTTPAAAAAEAPASQRVVEQARPGAVRTPSLTFPSAPLVAVATDRPTLTRVTGSQQGTSFSAEVEITMGDRSAVRRTEGLASRVGINHLIAGATVDALDGLHDLGRQLGVEFVDILASAAGDVAVVGVAIADSAGERMVTGSASVRNGNRLDAIARAVLDAADRRR